MTVAEQIELACLLEVTARKPGNVHPAARFLDLTYDDFVAAARAIGEPLAVAESTGLGHAVYNAVQATRQATGTNVNLGIVLLLAPLACVAGDRPLAEGVAEILQRTTVEDAEWVYAAIRLAQPGGMGEASEQDVNARPTVTLREAMLFAADRDTIADQYAHNFRLVFEARAKLCDAWNQLGDWEAAIVYLHLWLMARCPDTLIARKCGRELAVEASVRAQALIERTTVNGRILAIDPDMLREFDDWLRADRHRRNPGATADLIAATLFSAFRDNDLKPPPRAEIRERAAAIQIESWDHPYLHNPSSKSD